MVTPEEVKRRLRRELFNPPKEILQVIHERKRVRQKELSTLINDARKHKAERLKKRTHIEIEVPKISPTTLHKHLERLTRDEAIRKDVVRHKEVYYLPSVRFDEEWTNANIIEAVARLLNTFDRSLGLMEAIRVFERLRGKPNRMKELENSARMLCRVFDGELPELKDEEYVVIQVYQEDET